MSRVLSNVFSLLITACLYFGSGSVHLFAFYIIATFTVLGVFCLFLANEKMSRSPWQVAFSVPVTVLQITALVLTGYPGWAAANAMVSFILYALCIQNHKKGVAA